MWSAVRGHLCQPVHHAGTNSLLSFSWNVAWMVSTLVAGGLIEHVGFSSVMLTTIGFYVAVSLVILLCFGREGGRGPGRSGGP